MPDDPAGAREVGRYVESPARSKMRQALWQGIGFFESVRDGEFKDSRIVKLMHEAVKEDEQEFYERPFKND